MLTKKDAYDEKMHWNNKTKFHSNILYLDKSDWKNVGLIQDFTEEYMQSYDVRMWKCVFYNLINFIIIDSTFLSLNVNN